MSLDDENVAEISQRLTSWQKFIPCVRDSDDIPANQQLLHGAAIVNKPGIISRWAKPIPVGLPAQVYLAGYIWPRNARLLAPVSYAHTHSGSHTLRSLFTAAKRQALRYETYGCKLKLSVNQ